MAPQEEHPGAAAAPDARKGQEDEFARLCRNFYEGADPRARAVVEAFELRTAARAPGRELRALRLQRAQSMLRALQAGRPPRPWWQAA